MKLTGLWWWIDRWRKSTAYTGMTLEQQGAYRNLLDEASLRGGPLPDDEEFLAKACGDPRRWRSVREKVMAHFRKADDGWRNETLDEVLRAGADLRDTRSASGRKGAERRWQSHGKDHGKPDSKSDGKSDGKVDSKPDGKDDSKTIALRPEPKVPSEHDARAIRTGPAIGLLKPHGNVAFEGLRVWVPWKLHYELTGLRNNPNANQELHAFYQRVSEAWTTGAHASDEVDPEMFNFWRARYKEAWPPTKLEAVDPVRATQDRDAREAKNRYGKPRAEAAK